MSRLDIRVTWLWLACTLHLLAPTVVTAAGPEPDKEVHLSVWSLPRPEDTSIYARCSREVTRAFLRKYPYVRLSSPTGIMIPEMSTMDTQPLMAIAGGMSPDVIYVNFRQSDTYIQEGFLYPLDEWFEALSKEEQEERLLPQVRKVVYRWGPGKRTGRDPGKHYWALPYGNYIKGLCWRKDLFQAVGLDPERPPANWEELLDFARRCTNPEKGTYGILWAKGPHWSWFFYSLLCSAGANAMEDRGEDEWHAAFNSPGAVDAYEFVLELVQGRWKSDSGRTVEGVVYREDRGGLLWEEGRIGMYEIYFTEDLLADINPELVGIAPVPQGPAGKRGSELNCTMCGIYSGAARKGPEVLDAAWKYVHFLGSPEARAIKTRVLVENGYGMFANPTYLEKLGYTDYLRRIPQSWRDAFREAMDNGEPEPYGRNCQMVYNYMTLPADEMILRNLGVRPGAVVEAARRRLLQGQPNLSAEVLAGKLEKVEASARKSVRGEIQAILDDYVGRANEKMVGRVPPEELRRRRLVASLVAAVIAAAFTALFAYVTRVFTPPGAKGRWLFRRYWFAYLILLPALLSVALWQYLPMAWGAAMAFLDYHIVLPSRMVWLDNFAAVLWEREFWQSLLVSVWYAVLAIGMGFLAPILLAILLHEVPKGKILFRTLYYLPAVISGLVVMLMWKNFFEPSDRGLLNQVITAVPAWGFYAGGVAGVLVCGTASCFNYAREHRIAGLILALLALVLASGTLALHEWVELPLKPQRWLEDPAWAMPCVILPTVWAGIGPGCLIYLAALKTIPEDLYEAADLDGAGFLGKAWHITVPTIKVLIAINFIGAVVNAFRVAEYILAMTGGGPAGATNVLALKIFFDAFVYLRFGFATATAWVLGAMLIGFTVFRLKSLSKVEFRTATSAGL